MKRASVLFLACLLLRGVCAADGPTFEVASVKITGADTQQSYSLTGGTGADRPGRLHITRYVLLQLLMKAFDVGLDQIRGPAWMTSSSQSSFNIDAVVPAGATTDQFRKMLQNLLIERFHLDYHRESRGFPGYELAIDKGGPKIKALDAIDVNDEHLTDDALRSARRDKEHFPLVSGSFVVNVVTQPGKIRTKFQQRSMAELVTDLASVVRAGRGLSMLDARPRILDRTGLTGKYTFVLEYRDPTVASSSQANEINDAPDIFSAIREQLGLRLDKAADVSTEVIVVDSLEKIPTEN